jgi:hypothetical protein
MYICFDVWKQKKPIYRKCQRKTRWGFGLVAFRWGGLGEELFFKGVKSDKDAAVRVTFQSSELPFKIKLFLCHDMIYLSTAVGLTPGGSSTVHIYTQTVHRTAQITRTTQKQNNTNNNITTQITTE